MSIIDFTQYQAPGVYVQQFQTPLINVIGITPTVIGIVGPSRGYKVATEAWTLTGTTPITLRQLGCNTASVTVVDGSGNVYIPSTDFTTAVIGGSPDTFHQQVTVVRAGGSGIPSASVVYITYQYTDFNYFSPATYNSVGDVKAAYGEPLNLTSNTITSPISLAALLAFTNGAQQVVVLPTADVGGVATRANLSAAYAALASSSVDIIVPLPVGLTGTPGSPGDVINVGTDLATFCTTQAGLGNFCVGIIGYESTVTTLPDVIASTIANFRIMESWPFALNYYNGTNNQTFVVSGYYLAAAYAGRMAAQNVQEPLTQKQIRGFSSIPNSVFTSMTIPYKNQLSAAGVAVTEPNAAGGLQVRHGVTTLGTSINAREMSLVRAGDVMVDLIHDTLDASGLIGSPFGPNSLLNVKNLVGGALEQLVAQGVIQAYTGLGVQQMSGNPVVVAVMFNYSPSYPLNYILVTFSIDTTTGEVNPVVSAPSSASV